MMRPRCGPAFSLALVASLAAGLSGGALAPGAHAATTQYWTLRSAADHQATELEGVALGPDGALRSGPQLTPRELPGSPVVWAALAQGDRLFLATGPGGRVLTVRGSDVRADSTGDAQALALAQGEGGALYVGTGPNGRVVRFASNGTRTTYFETGQKYVWALAFLGKTLYAATGPLGKLYAIDGPGQGKVVLDARAAHLTALATDGKGTLFVGASGRGIVYAVTGGRARALFEAPEKEIRALAWDGRALYAAAMTAAPISIDDATLDPASGEGQRSVVYRIVPDSAAAAHWISPQGLVYALLAADGRLWAATGSRAALYRVDARGKGDALWAGGEGQVTALAPAGGGEVWLATSNPSRLYRVRPGGGTGTAISPAFDAKRTARWGRLWADGDASGARFSTRSGNTASADSTWSDWSALAGDGHVNSPPARWLQWKLALPGASTGSIRAVTVAWGEVNQRPRIEDFTAYPVPGKFYEGELNVRRDPITQELPDGRRVQFSIDSPRKANADVLPPWAQGIRPLAWKASDPNGDDLAYRLFVRRVGESAWTPIASGLSTTLYAWDTTSWPDGRYEIKLVATDEDQNPPGEGLDDETIVGPIDLDRTPPSFSALEAKLEGTVAVVRGRATDAGLYVSRVDVGFDDDATWYPAAPDDGLWDEPSEAFTLRLEGLPAGEHLLRVRITDALGNAATSSRTVRIGR
ncbi:MAG: hypothetical protein ABI960_09600 [Candidatus Eisenbacteria bacterium]